MNYRNASLASSRYDTQYEQGLHHQHKPVQVAVLSPHISSLVVATGFEPSRKVSLSKDNTCALSPGWGRGSDPTLIIKHTA